MPDGNDPLIPRPPSAFHNEAWLRAKRQPKHDLLQQEVLAFLRQRPVCGIPENTAVHRHVEGEFALRKRGQIVSFADAAEVLDVNLTCIVSLFEIKPRIETVFGIVRQAKAMLGLVAETVPRATQAYCHVVVPADDPLLADLRREWPHTWAWGFAEEEGED